MADMNGKGICYDDDDSPIQVTDQDDSPTIHDYRLSLIGKILNPKKQTVEKLIQTMSAQWGMQDRITANNLGNGKFLLNFLNEDDIKAVLYQGPFHYNFCMFVLVRWEPVVHDDYPWIIPFWVEITGIPLHMWTIKNLRNIGGRLGHNDTVELSAGRLLLDVDTRKPLTFSRKIASPEGEEVTIQIHYEKLFKHCSSCGMVTHEMAYCPQKVNDFKNHGVKTGVFARVQLPVSDGSRQFSLRDQKPYDKYGNYADLRVRTSRYEDGFMKDARRSQNNNDRKDGSSDQFRRFQPEHDRNYDKDTRKYSGNARKIALMSSRHGSRYAPYGTRLSQSWRIKERRNSREVEDVIEPYARTPQPALSEHSSTNKSDGVLEQEGHRSSGKRIASTIVTPV
ncbi:hypothetical protein F2Q69_00014327 [Brassica cretica]|uniref:DUF4283 domain-containing protein n=1 Tax=Brassica cretica TaxID=69181 RepID=A0A8S9R7K0_BRACR|nr:hypothetical protein F2Q69_00014327 [Brassica cretica]